MIDTMRDHLIQDFPPERMERAGNTKTHGIVRAEFIVHDGLPEHLRHGIFAKPRTLQGLGALLRTRARMPRRTSTMSASSASASS